jgi:uncharacterized Zn finger protein (UPF0148 family)
MAALTLTALDLAEERQNFAPAPTPGRESERPVEDLRANSAQQTSVIPITIPIAPEFAETAVSPVAPAAVLAEPPVVRAEPTIFPAELPVVSVAPPVIPSASPVVPAEPAVLPAEPSVDLAPEPEPVLKLEPAPVPEAMLRVQKCASCGFPVSEGRTLCLDCEKKDTEEKAFEKKQRDQAQGEIERQIERQKIDQGEQDASSDSVGASAAASVSAGPEEFVPAFLANSPTVQESWLANHVNLLAVVVLILGILVAVVVFR